MKTGCLVWGDYEKNVYHRKAIVSRALKKTNSDNE